LVFLLLLLLVLVALKQMMEVHHRFLQLHQQVVAVVEIKDKQVDQVVLAVEAVAVLIMQEVVALLVKVTLAVKVLKMAVAVAVAKELLDLLLLET
jgi:hypothetical protein